MIPIMKRWLRLLDTRDEGPDPEPDWISDYRVTMGGFPEPAFRFEDREGATYAFTASDVWRRCRRGIGWGWEKVTTEEEPVRKIAEGSRWDRWMESTARLNGPAPDWVEKKDDA